MLYFGFIFGLAGLLINASYIDVFEASKVAFVFWCVAGAIIASLPYIKEIDLNVAEEPKKEKKKK
jgi:hypothetical protein